MQIEEIDRRRREYLERIEEEADELYHELQHALELIETGRAHQAANFIRSVVHAGPGPSWRQVAGLVVPSETDAD